MEFDTFEDKSSAINADTGVNKRLAYDLQVASPRDEIGCWKA
jgi:hypothetical protein